MKEIYLVVRKKLREHDLTVRAFEKEVDAVNYKLGILHQKDILDHLEDVCEDIEAIEKQALILVEMTGDDWLSISDEYVVEPLKVY